MSVFDLSHLDVGGRFESEGHSTEVSLFLVG